PLPDGIEISLVGDGVLEVAEVIAFVRQQFKECDAQVGRVALEPSRVELWDQVEEEPAETRVVLGEVVDERLGGALGWADFRRAAVEIDRTSGLEVDGRDRELQIESWNLLLEGPIGLELPAEGEMVVGEVAFLADGDLEPAAGERHLKRANADDAGPALHGHEAEILRQGESVGPVGIGVQRRGEWLEEGNDQKVGVDCQRAALVLDEVDAVQDRVRKDISAALGVPADRTEFDDGWHIGLSPRPVPPR